MTDASLLQAQALSIKFKDIVACLSLETPYGLVVDFGGANGGLVNVRLAASDPNSSSLETAASQIAPLHSDRSDVSVKKDSSRPTTYYYTISSSFRTPPLWYDYWPGRPQVCYVDLEDVEERYKSASWVDTFDRWNYKWQDAFDRVPYIWETGEEVFPDLNESRSFRLEGMLLGCWLALQPGVDGVKYYETEEGRHCWTLEEKNKQDGNSLVNTLMEFLHVVFAKPEEHGTSNT
ncbi:hypothetical protein QBC46DRAFT_338627 [Diplogelasinospora grovesii]|uniref:Uncharacterized protein n=1 Tax=Diplogelasinospora grovesii TaxID=303347 RepID=A0AAN6NDU7_9PEZI|nr:hypothetical protein QBC46DRAFT_338627 [Diplogelasinospora grovesii]